MCVLVVAGLVEVERGQWRGHKSTGLCYYFTHRNGGVRGEKGKERGV